MSVRYLIELYSDMPTNRISDAKLTGDVIIAWGDDAFKLVDFMLDEKVEFSLSRIGDCLIDLSYKYWEV